MNKIHPPRRLGRSIAALLAGFIAVVVLSIATDALLRAVGLSPKLGQPMGDGLFALATIYRGVYSIIGSYITARLSPYRPMLHAMIGGAIGLLLAFAGAIATWNRGPAFGPHWYPVSLILTALPCAWIGGKLCENQSRSHQS